MVEERSCYRSVSEDDRSEAKDKTVDSAKAEKKQTSPPNIIRRGGRVVDCSGLENRRRVTYREFESLSLRHF